MSLGLISPAATGFTLPVGSPGEKCTSWLLEATHINPSGPATICPFAPTPATVKLSSVPVGSLGLNRAAFSTSVTQRLPSGPGAIPSGLRTPSMSNSSTCPVGVTFATSLVPSSTVNQIFPSGPATILLFVLISALSGKVPSMDGAAEADPAPTSRQPKAASEAAKVATVLPTPRSLTGDQVTVSGSSVSVAVASCNGLPPSPSWSRQRAIPSCNGSTSSSSVSPAAKQPGKGGNQTLPLRVQESR